ncbi:GGDEF domain-containing protein [Hydrogenovibrio halophilus]|uniref:GGDEF domain-containing protein n=1 Tax=Hydrogenovibrio halophilus TaxID=373391 RepID=UPI00037058C5|nr:sensor domain-containing diguanylate cyclase [Hydrogenovibrio halophilus]
MWQPISNAQLPAKILTLLTHSDTVIFYCRYAPDWPVEYLSDNFEVFGYTPAAFYDSRLSYRDLVHPEDLDKLEKAVEQAVESGEAYVTRQIRLKKADQHYAWVDMRITFERDDENRVTHLLGKMVDITAQIQDRERLEVFARVVEQTGDLVKITDRAGRLVFVNQALQDKTGYSEEEMLGRKPSMLKSELQDPKKAKELWETILEGKVYHNRIINRCKDGRTYHEETTISPVCNAEGEIEYFVSTGKDVSEQVKMQQQLNELAMKDALTHLYNRRHLSMVLEAEIKRADRYGTQFGLVMFDVDHFKEINDTFGHDVGDDVLCRMADAVREEVRESDQLGRWGGEEFLLIALGLNKARTDLLAEKIRKLIADIHFPVAGRVTVSIGATGYHPNEGEMMLLKRADQALYLAKKKGRNRVESL